MYVLAYIKECERTVTCWKISDCPKVTIIKEIKTKKRRTFPTKFDDKNLSCILCIQILPPFPLKAEVRFPL